MGLTQVSTGGVKDDAITKAKIPANQIEASELADNAVDTNAIANNAITQAKINVPISNRNLIINGSMQVAQRATTYTGADNYNTVDRIKTIHSGLNEDVTSSQHELSSSDTPYSLGFRHSYHIQNGNQSAGAGAEDFLSMQYRIEAQDLARSGWDYKSTSSYVTLSFWVKSSVAQSFGCFLRTHDGSQMTFPFETGALTADAWTKITKTISGNGAISFSTDNGTGIEINISQFWGTNYTSSGKTLDAWASYSNDSRLKDFPASTWYTTNDATFEITGLQLEVGSVATTFEHRSFSQELALCQRYFQQTYSVGNKGGDTVRNGGVSGLAINGAFTRIRYSFKTEMRAAPTVTLFASSSGTTNKFRNTDDNQDVNGSVDASGTSSVLLVMTDTGLSTGKFIEAMATASAEL